MQQQATPYEDESPRQFLLRVTGHDFPHLEECTWEYVRNYPPMSKWFADIMMRFYHPKIVLTQPATQPTTQIKIYKNSRDFQRDAAKLAKKGWTIAHQTANQRSRSLGGKLFIPFGIFTKKSEIIVTYTKWA